MGFLNLFKKIKKILVVIIVVYHVITKKNIWGKGYKPFSFWLRIGGERLTEK